MVLMETHAETEPLTAPVENDHPPTHPCDYAEWGRNNWFVNTNLGGCFLTQTMKTDKGRDQIIAVIFFKVMRVN